MPSPASKWAPGPQAMPLLDTSPPSSSTRPLALGIATAVGLAGLALAVGLPAGHTARLHAAVPAPSVGSHASHSVLWTARAQPHAAGFRLAPPAGSYRPQLNGHDPADAVPSGGVGNAVQQSPIAWAPASTVLVMLAGAAVAAATLWRSGWRAHGAASATGAAPVALCTLTSARTGLSAAVAAKCPASLTELQWQTAALLEELGQAHLFADWAAAEEEADRKAQFLDQVGALDAQYPGGLRAYVQKARALLRDSEAGVNAFEGYVPELAQGQSLDWDRPEFEEFEERGLADMGAAAFVLVAGGLGERLGYQGIKVELPAELSTGISYLELYCRWLLALGQRSGTAPPLAIMTSDETHVKTAALLQRNDYFGLQPDQVTLLKQEPVPALANGDGHFCHAAGDPYRLATKPHGHGDVHALLHRSGVAADWAAAGMRWAVFLQDTNSMTFRAVPSLLGVSVAQNLQLNFCCIPRKPKQEIGAVAQLVAPGGTAMTCNIEYNQLDPLLRAVQRLEGKPETGDTALGDADVSPFPGNINILVIDLTRYTATLSPTDGIIPEFVNPKYVDGSRTSFKSPTRLECMMQDYAKLLPPDALVGTTCYTEPWVFNPVKRPAMLATSEQRQYLMNARYLRAAGVELPFPTASDPQDVRGLPQVACVQLLPGFACSKREVQRRFPGGPDCRISARSTLILDGDITVDRLDLDGALEIHAVPGAQVRVKRLVVRNAGCRFVRAEQGVDVAAQVQIRGYDIERMAVTKLVFDAPGSYEVDEVHEA